MVRFIIAKKIALMNLNRIFTFHYGQIYYNLKKEKIKTRSAIYIPLWLDLLCGRKSLSSSSNFLFTFHYGQIYYLKALPSKFTLLIFTFHYGQIYYTFQIFNKYRRIDIYIPLWLDLLYITKTMPSRNGFDLHSTMVRFIINKDFIFANEPA